MQQWFKRLDHQVRLACVKHIEGNEIVLRRLEQRIYSQLILRALAKHKVNAVC
jgi:hypothetical protein